MGWGLTKSENTIVDCAGPGLVLCLSPTVMSSLSKIAKTGRRNGYRNDCPQRREVLMQSSVKLTGSLRHSVARGASISLAGYLQRESMRVRRPEARRLLGQKTRRTR